MHAIEMPPERAPQTDAGDAPEGAREDDVAHWSRGVPRQTLTRAERRFDRGTPMDSPDELEWTVDRPAASAGRQPWSTSTRPPRFPAARPSRLVGASASWPGEAAAGRARLRRHPRAGGGLTPRRRGRCRRRARRCCALLRMPNTRVALVVGPGAAQPGAGRRPARHRRCWSARTASRSASTDPEANLTLDTAEMRAGRGAARGARRGGGLGGPGVAGAEAGRASPCTRARDGGQQRASRTSSPSARRRPRCETSTMRRRARTCSSSRCADDEGRGGRAPAALHAAPTRSSTPGDDVTDEDAFAALSSHDLGLKSGEERDARQLPRGGDFHRDRPRDHPARGPPRGRRPRSSSLLPKPLIRSWIRAFDGMSVRDPAGEHQTYMSRSASYSIHEFVLCSSRWSLRRRAASRWRDR